MSQTPYTAIPGLEHLYLEDSYVLDIVARPGTLFFILDLVLLDGHPHYEQPPPDERACFRRARLVFTGVRQLQWAQSGLKPSIDATGETDYGNVDSYTVHGTTHELEGDWGSLSVVASDVRVEFDDAPAPVGK